MSSRFSFSARRNVATMVNAALGDLGLVRDRSQVDRTSECEVVTLCWAGTGRAPGMAAAFGCSAAADGRLRAPPPRSTRAGHGANSLASWWSVGAEGGGGGAGGAGESLVPDVSAGCNPGGGSNADSSSCAWPRRLAERPHIRRGSEPWSVVHALAHGCEVQFGLQSKHGSTCGSQTSAQFDSRAAHTQRCEQHARARKDDRLTA